MCLLMVSTLLVIGCEKGDSRSQAIQQKEKPRAEHSPFSISEVMKHLPINMEAGFDKFHGWIHNETIVYSTKHHQQSNLYAYDLKNGTSTLLFKLDSIIDDIQISHSGNYLLIRSSSEAFPCQITVINSKGETIFSTVLEDTYDVEIKWNPYDEDKVLISSFTEDWQDQTFILSLDKQKITQIELANPFSYWISSNKLIYFDWSPEVQSELSNVKLKNITNGEVTLLLSNVLQLDSFSDYFLAITADEKQPENMNYRFYDAQVNQIASISMPRITNDSGWFIPYYDYNEAEKSFLTFQQAGSYEEGFQLVKHQLLQGENHVIIDGLNNEPIKCNEEGSLCLYGYYFEKLIDIKTKKNAQLVQMDE
ncbi:YqgU-like beta propeller domain-containing protein [Bacillus tuaregi]|uniref:YqgU-like beta propeller domain-containing protein n=1 Tax=Bacillus tuaregi TaxID=1816695 RepID=UPI00111450BB|nr:hypothetical protein [Bacillus tuaregi]